MPTTLDHGGIPPAMTGFQFLAVALGGACGAMLRTGITVAAVAIGWTGMVGTLIANWLGCVGIGALAGYTLAASQNEAAGSPPSDWATMFLRAGLLGSLTTMSTFVAESVQLWTDHRGFALAYFAATLAGGVLAYVLASAAARQWWLGG